MLPLLRGMRTLMQITIRAMTSTPAQAATREVGVAITVIWPLVARERAGMRSRVGGERGELRRYLCHAGHCFDALTMVDDWSLSREEAR